MEFLLAMSIFSSAADISREKGRAQVWGATREDAAAVEQGSPPRQSDASRAQKAREPQETKGRGRPHFALEFDGINGLETIVSR